MAGAKRRINPASKLHERLRILTVTPDGDSLRNAWSKVLGVQPQDTLGICKGLVTMQKSADIIKKEISAITDINHDLYLACFPNIEKALAFTNFDGAYGNINVTERALSWRKHQIDSCSTPGGVMHWFVGSIQT
jgi:hypothetical protein